MMPPHLKLKNELFSISFNSSLPGLPDLEQLNYHYKRLSCSLCSESTSNKALLMLAQMGFHPDSTLIIDLYLKDSLQIPHKMWYQIKGEGLPYLTVVQ